MQQTFRKSGGKQTNWDNWHPKIAEAMQDNGFTGLADLQRAIVKLAENPNISAYYPDLKDHAMGGRVGQFVFKNRRSPISPYYNNAAKDLPDATPGRLKKMPEMIALALGVPCSSIFERPAHLPECKTMLEEQGFYDIL